MLIIIDGYNVLKTMRGTSDYITHQERTAFIANLNKYAAIKKHTIVVVFDGGPYDRPMKEVIGSVVVIYTGKTINTDNYIKEYSAAYQPSATLMVSSDKEIKDFARKNGIVTIDSMAFYHRIQEVLVKKTPYIKMNKQKAEKLDDADQDDYIDALMHEASKVAVITKDELIEDRRAKNGKRLKKSQKKLLQQLKKL